MEGFSEQAERLPECAARNTERLSECTAGNTERLPECTAGGLGHYKMILASGSPRRRELMEQMGLNFTVDTVTSFEEIIPEGVAPEDVPSLFAEGKSLGFHRKLEEDEVLLSADTVVVCGGRIMGKPASVEQAREMLHLLSGREHKVVSAVCMRSNNGIQTLSDTAYVEFEPLSDSEIDYYIQRYRPLDKAGAYGIQEWIGMIGIRAIRGSFYSIMGLPTHLLYRLLRTLPDSTR